VSLPILNPSGTDLQAITGRVNVLIRDYNLRRSSQTVANLPTGADMGFGARTFVTDANATTFRAVVAGGGANTVPVYFDGSDWRIG
jgi:hypothetical protein